MKTNLNTTRRDAFRYVFGGGVSVILGATTSGCAAIPANDDFKPSTPPPAAPQSIRQSIVPVEWMPPANMKRVICHWTAGTHRCGKKDRQSYHIIIEADGNLQKGFYDISANENRLEKGAYAAHTLNCNTGSIGVSLACMAGAKEHPFNPGKYPMTRIQWETLSQVVADLCRRYAIPVESVLSHAEVESRLGIKQRNKWDYTRLPFNLNLVGAVAVGNDLRQRVHESLE